MADDDKKSGILSKARAFLHDNVNLYQGEFDNPLWGAAKMTLADEWTKSWLPTSTLGAGAGVLEDLTGWDLYNKEQNIKDFEEQTGLKYQDQKALNAMPYDDRQSALKAQQDPGTIVSNELGDMAKGIGSLATEGLLAVTEPALTEYTASQTQGDNDLTSAAKALGGAGVSGTKSALKTAEEMIAGTVESTAGTLGYGYNPKTNEVEFNTNTLEKKWHDEPISAIMDILPLAQGAKLAKSTYSGVKAEVAAAEKAAVEEAKAAAKAAAEADAGTVSMRAPKPVAPPNIDAAKAEILKRAAKDFAEGSAIIGIDALLPIGIPVGGKGAALARDIQTGSYIEDAPLPETVKPSSFDESKGLAAKQYLVDASAGVPREVQEALNARADIRNARRAEMDLAGVPQPQGSAARDFAALGGQWELGKPFLDKKGNLLPEAKQKIYDRQIENAKLRDLEVLREKLLNANAGENPVVFFEGEGTPPKGYLDITGTKLAQELKFDKSANVDMKPGDKVFIHPASWRYATNVADDLIGDQMLRGARKLRSSFGTMKILFNAKSHLNQLASGLILTGADSGFIRGSAKTLKNAAQQAFDFKNLTGWGKRGDVAVAKRWGILDTPDLQNADEVIALRKEYPKAQTPIQVFMHVAGRVADAPAELNSLVKRASGPLNIDIIGRLGKIFSTFDAAAKLTVTTNTLKDFYEINKSAFKGKSYDNWLRELSNGVESPLNEQARRAVTARVYNVMPNYNKNPLALNIADKHAITPFANYQWANVNTYVKSLRSPLVKSIENLNEEREQRNDKIQPLLPSYLGGEAVPSKDGTKYYESKSINPFPVRTLDDLLKFPAILKNSTNFLETAHPQRAQDLLPGNPWTDALRVASGIDPRTNRPLTDERRRDAALKIALPPSVNAGMKSLNEEFNSPLQALIDAVKPMTSKPLDLATAKDAARMGALGVKGDINEMVKTTKSEMRNLDKKAKAADKTGDTDKASRIREERKARREKLKEDIKKARASGDKEKAYLLMQQLRGY